MSRSPGRPSPQEIVAAGYDRIAERYLAWSGLRPSATRQHALALAVAAIPLGADVLELGCGAGLPMTAHLAPGRTLTGVDISAAQVALARVNVPGATFVQADLSTLDWPAGSFDAVVAFYVLTHVPRTEHAALLGRIRRWLRPGGVFLASFGVEDDPGGVEADWLGVDMYFSHFSARVNRRLVAAAGLEIESAEVLAEPGDRFDARFLWVLARAPRDPAG
ncbi:MAG TPA: methyltransferase domain-containing protein [Patescibacteria group bacterium]|nr:methyltransferase domain-containing protein [Patescibacteria group bacterium]